MPEDDPGPGPSVEEIEEQAMTQHEVADHIGVQPSDTVTWHPEWDEHPEEQPGKNARIEDEVLIWEQEYDVDGVDEPVCFEARLECEETTVWKAVVSLPEYVGKNYPRSVDLQCRPDPEYGFVETVEMADDPDVYAAREATLYYKDNFQPTVQVECWMRDLLKDALDFEASMAAIDEKMAAAKANTRSPPETEPGDAFECPVCREDIYHLTRETVDDSWACPECEADVEGHYSLEPSDSAGNAEL